MSAPRKHLQGGIGGPAPTPLLMRACELLDDRAWHEVETILRDLGKLVPPAQALRKVERARRQGPDAPAQRVKQVTTERQIQYGQRAIARELLTGKSFKVVKHDDGTYWVRMVRLPSRVLAERSRQRAHRLYTPERLADELAGGAHARALIEELTYNQLVELAIELAYRARTQREQEQGAKLTHVT